MERSSRAPLGAAVYTHVLGFAHRPTSPSARRAGSLWWLSTSPKVRSWCWSPTAIRPPGRSRRRWWPTGSRPPRCCRGCAGRVPAAPRPRRPVPEDLTVHSCRGPHGQLFLVTAVGKLVSTWRPRGWPDADHKPAAGTRHLSTAVDRTGAQSEPEAIGQTTIQLGHTGPHGAGEDAEHQSMREPVLVDPGDRL
jgi:hypothetical protein